MGLGLGWGCEGGRLYLGEAHRRREDEIGQPSTMRGHNLPRAPRGAEGRRGCRGNRRTERAEEGWRRVQRVGEGRRGVQRTQGANGVQGGAVRTSAARCHAAMSSSSLAAGRQRSTLSPVRLATRIACSSAAAVAWVHQISYCLDAWVTAWTCMVAASEMRMVAASDACGYSAAEVASRFLKWRGFLPRSTSSTCVAAGGGAPAPPAVRA